MLTLVAMLAAQTDANAQDELTGMFRISHTTPEIVGAQMALDIADQIAPNIEFQWQVYVPPGYERRNPPGVVVFVDPDGWGGMPDQYRQLFISQNLIWVGANRSHTGTTPMQAVWASVLGLRAIEQDYAINLNRVYIISTGSGASTAVNVLLNASEFVGAAYIGGSAYWGSLEPDRLQTLQRKRHVFVTGSNDQASTAVRTDYDRYKHAGINNVKLVFDPKGPGLVLKSELMQEVLVYLDSGHQALTH